MRSGIADYSRDLIPHLARHCDLRVIAVPGQAIAEDLQEDARVTAPHGLDVDLPDLPTVESNGYLIRILPAGNYLGHRIDLESRMNALIG